MESQVSPFFIYDCDRYYTHRDGIPLLQQGDYGGVDDAWMTLDLDILHCYALGLVKVAVSFPILLIPALVHLERQEIKEEKVVNLEFTKRFMLV